MTRALGPLAVLALAALVARASAQEGRTLGPANAPVTIVEYCDFECPICAQATIGLRELRKRYGSAIRIVFRDFPLERAHPNAPRAAAVAACGQEQGRFWLVHDLLYRSQPDFDPARIAAAAGLDVAAFDRCLASGRHAGDWKRDRAEGERLGVSGTPGFLINGRLLHDVRRVEDIERVIDAELARSGGTRR